LPVPAPRPYSGPISGPWSTFTFLSSEAHTIALGEPVSLTTRVVDLSRPHFHPTGTVVFMADGKRLGTAKLHDGKATLTTTALPVGRVRVRVLYLGTTKFRSSRSDILFERVDARGPDARQRDH
jgi:hypothetical protein